MSSSSSRVGPTYSTPAWPAAGVAPAIESVYVAGVGVDHLHLEARAGVGHLRQPLRRVGAGRVFDRDEVADIEPSVLARDGALARRAREPRVVQERRRHGGDVFGRGGDRQFVSGVVHGRGDLPARGLGAGLVVGVIVDVGDRDAARQLGLLHAGERQRISGLLARVDAAEVVVRDGGHHALGRAAREPEHGVALARIQEVGAHQRLDAGPRAGYAVDRIAVQRLGDVGRVDLAGRTPARTHRSSMTSPTFTSLVATAVKLIRRYSPVVPPCEPGPTMA
jgi:hypothetical protein